MRPARQIWTVWDERLVGESSGNVSKVLFLYLPAYSNIKRPCGRAEEQWGIERRVDTLEETNWYKFELSCREREGKMSKHLPEIHKGM